jgi:hypothetical protein
MRIKQILWWMLILTLVSTAVACQSAGPLAASAISSVAALPASASLPQATQNYSGIFLTAIIGPTCIRTTWYGPECGQPYVGEFVVTALNGAEITRVWTNYQGQATVALPPGKYIVGVRTEDVSAWTAPQIVNVFADRYASISFGVNADPGGQTAGIP